MKHTNELFSLREILPFNYKLSFYSKYQYKTTSGATFLRYNTNFTFNNILARRRKIPLSFRVISRLGRNLPPPPLSMLINNDNDDENYTDYYDDI